MTMNTIDLNPKMLGRATLHNVFRNSGTFHLLTRDSKPVGVFVPTDIWHNLPTQKLKALDIPPPTQMSDRLDIKGSPPQIANHLAYVSRQSGWCVVMDGTLFTGVFVAPGIWEKIESTAKPAVPTRAPTFATNGNVGRKGPDSRLKL